MNLIIHTNAAEVAQRLQARLLKAQDKDKLLRTVAVSLLPEVRHRIHQDGQAADGSQIGIYKDSYMPIRRKHNRGEDRKVILSLTSFMENSFVAVADGTRYGLGYINALPAQSGKSSPISNSQKARYAEERFGKKIFALTPGEIQTGRNVATKFLSDALHG
jgi:hypothetical protein